MKVITKLTGLTLGLDLGDSKTKFAVLSADGELLEEGTIGTSPAEFQRVFARFSDAVVALEAGSQSRWSSELLSELGLKVYVANPRQLKLIYGSVDKDDRLDAVRLARLARVDSTLLHQVFHRSNTLQADLEVIKARDTLVDCRTKIINHIRGVLKSFGVKVRKCATKIFHRTVVEFVPEELKPGVIPLVETLEALTAKISEYEKEIDRLGKEKYQNEMDTARQVCGVGLITGITYVLTLGDLTRFPKSRILGSYLGLRPRRSESGDSSPQLQTTRAGNRRLRRLLIQSAQYALGPFGKDCDLRRWGLKKAEGGKRMKKRAIVAVARKLAVLLHRLLTTGEMYEPLRQAKHAPPIAA